MPVDSGERSLAGAPWPSAPCTKAAKQQPPQNLLTALATAPLTRNAKWHSLLGTVDGHVASILTAAPRDVRRKTVASL